MFTESLESRCLLSAVYPTAQEQYFVELTNRARANPAAEAARYGIDLNEGPPSKVLTAAPKQPLAINPYITSSARKYSVTLLDPPAGSNPKPGELSHVLDSTTPGKRAMAQGYASESVSENLVAVPQAGSSPTVASIDWSHLLLFKDFTDTIDIKGRGHRVNILDPGAKEIGLGLAVGKFGGNNTLMGTQDFGLASAQSYLTGVVYADKVTDDDFYTPGEGLGKITIRAQRKSDGAKFATKTWAAGGYTLALAPGTYTISAAGPALGKTLAHYNVVVGTENVKRDFVKPGDKDSTAPMPAMLQATNLATGGGKTYTFTVTYSDLHAIKASTLDNTDIWITAKGFSQVASLVSKAPSTDATSIIATYRITAPGGVWDAADNKLYTVKLAKNQVTDLAGKSVPHGKLGTFRVKIV